VSIKLRSISKLFLLHIVQTFTRCFQFSFGPRHLRRVNPARTSGKRRREDGRLPEWQQLLTGCSLSEVTKQNFGN